MVVRAENQGICVPKQTRKKNVTVTNIITDDLQRLVLNALACIRQEIASLTHIEKKHILPKGKYGLF